ERAGVNNAELAFWNHYGTLGDTLTDTGGSPNAAYWLYRWYGQMSGNMVTVVPPGTAGSGLDGAASVNSAGNQVTVIFGGGSGSGTLAVQATASGSSTQRWTLVSEGSNFYQIKNSASGLVLGVQNMSISDGGDALIWGDNGSSDHLWQVVPAGSGQYKIQ